MGSIGIRRVCLYFVLTVLATAIMACKKDEGNDNTTSLVRVRSVRFVGVHGVDESALKRALATRASSRLPWGTKRYFSRAQFDDDLKRVLAFYTDRGFPNARVTSYDVKLNAARTGSTSLSPWMRANRSSCHQ